MKNKWLKGLGIFDLEKQRLLEDLTAALKSSKGYYEKKTQTYRLQVILEKFPMML